MKQNWLQTAIKTAQSFCHPFRLADPDSIGNVQNIRDNLNEYLALVWTSEPTSAAKPSPNPNCPKCKGSGKERVLLLNRFKEYPCDCISTGAAGYLTVFLWFEPNEKQRADQDIANHETDFLFAQELSDIGRCYDAFISSKQFQKLTWLPGLPSDARDLTEDESDATDWFS